VHLHFFMDFFNTSHVGERHGKIFVKKPQNL
jgi:hypothetical protein